jgi:hypothetical protein
MYGRSSTIPYVRDLDADGFAELVIFDDLLITPTSRWQDEAFGMPHVYRLGDTMESRSLREYPAVVRDFIMQAEIAIDASTAPVQKRRRQTNGVTRIAGRWRVSPRMPPEYGLPCSERYPLRARRFGPFLTRKSTRPCRGARVGRYLRFE